MTHKKSFHSERLAVIRTFFQYLINRFKAFFKLFVLVKLLADVWGEWRWDEPTKACLNSVASLLGNSRLGILVIVVGIGQESCWV